MTRLYAAAKAAQSLEGGSALASALNESPQTINNWENRGVSLAGALKAQRTWGCDANWILTGVRLELAHFMTAQEQGPAYLPVIPGQIGNQGTGTIELSHAKGSCGGGHINGDDADAPKEALIKEARWFQHFNVKPDDLIAIYADGDSMADFIVDGDIVIFNHRITAMRNGEIYAIDTSDGLRIKRVHKRSDGTVVLSSDNQNKSRFPDEEYTPERAAGLRVAGQFVYRQGGG